MSSHHVYRAYDKSGSLLYVGATNDLERRLNSHRNDSGWWLFQDHVESEAFPSRAEAEAEETTLIQTLHPRWNVKDRVAGAPKAEHVRYLVERQIAREMGQLRRERGKHARVVEELDTSIAILTYAIEGMNADRLPGLRVVSAEGGAG
jgi:predicted GIY-YIG superfamily endonuclease